MESNDIMKNLFSFLLVATTTLAMGQKVRFYDVKSISQYQMVLEESMNKDKMIFLVIYEIGDAFYKMQKEDVFADPALANAYKTTVPLAVDIKSDMGGRLAESFALTQLPSFMYLTNDEALVLVKSGYLSALELKAALTNAITANLRYEELKVKFSKKELDNSDWIELIQFQSLNGSYNETQALAVGFLNGLTKQELLTDEVLPLITSYGVNLEHTYVKFIIENRKALKDKIDYEEFYQSAYSFNFDRATASKDSIMMDKIITTLLPHAPDQSTELEKVTFESQKVFASEAELFNIWKKAALQRSKSLSSDSAKAKFLFEEAYEMAQDFNTPKSNLASMQLAKKANALEAAFRYKMLESYMAYLIKDYDEAIKLVDEASDLVEDKEQQQKADNLKKMVQQELSVAPTKP